MTYSFRPSKTAPGWAHKDADDEMEISIGELHQESTLVEEGKEAGLGKKKSWAAMELWQRLQQTPRGALRWDGLQSCPALHGVFLLPHGPVTGCRMPPGRGCNVG